MTDLLAASLDDLKARRDSAKLHAERADVFPFAVEDYDALDALVRLLETATAREWRLVILESPYAGEIEANVDFARACMRDCLLRKEAPFASHLLYTQPGVLDDGNGYERARGIAAGLAWGEVADATIVYIDRGITDGMKQGVERAKALGRPVEYRTLAKSAPAATRGEGEGGNG